MLIRFRVDGSVPRSTATDICPQQFILHLKLRHWQHCVILQQAYSRNIFTQAVNRVTMIYGYCSDVLEAHVSYSVIHSNIFLNCFCCRNASSTDSVTISNWSADIRNQHAGSRGSVVQTITSDDMFRNVLLVRMMYFVLCNVPMPCSH